MGEGKVNGKSAEDLPVTCLSLVLKNVVYWWEMFLHFNHFRAFVALWMVCGEMREAAVPAVLVLSQLQRSLAGQGLVPWDTHLHIPSQTLDPMSAKCPEPLAVWGCKGKAAPFAVGVPCVCKSLHEQHSYPIHGFPAQTGAREKHRGSIYSPCHPLPESFVTRSSKYFSSAQLQRTQEVVGCGGSPCCPDRGQPSFRTSNTRPEKFPWETEVHPCSYEDPCYHGGSIPPKRLYCSKSVPVPLVLCFVVLRQWLSFSLSPRLLEQLESAGLSPEDYCSSSSWEKAGQSKDTE